MFHHQKKSSNKRNPTFLESERLHQEIEDLEDALILHARFQAESDNSVKQMIRKELGSTHWEHGGEGKLRTYKSGKDLCNQGMVMNPYLHKKAKDMKKWHTGSDDKNYDKSKRDNENSKAVMGTPADKKVRMLKKIKSTLDKKEQRDVASDVEDISELKITRIKTTPVIDESHEMIFDTADVNEDIIIKSLSLKDELSITRNEKSHPRKANYSSKLNINKVENKHSKASSHNSLSESSKVSDTCNLTATELIKSGTKMVHKKSASPLFISDADDNFTSGIQPSFNSTETKNVITKGKLNTQELDGRIDIDDKTLMFETFGHTNVSDNKTFVNEQYNEYEYSRSKTFLEDECHNRNSSDGSRFLSSKQDQGAVNKNKWAIKNNALLYIDSDCIRVPCGNSHTNDDSGGFYTDFEVLEDPQMPQYEVYEHTRLSNGDSVKKDQEQKGMNMFSTAGKAVPAVQSSMTNCTADNVNTSSELASSLSHCLNYGREDAKSMQAVAHADLSVTQHSSVCGKPSSLPETDFPQGKSSHHVDVETWLHSLGLESVEHYIQLFNDHQLDMSRVQLLSATDLRKMGIHAIGPIMKIMKGVQMLGRDNVLSCGSCDYTNNGGKERQNWDPVHRA